MKFSSNQAVIVNDEALERYGQAGAAVGEAEDGSIEVKFDSDDAIEHVPESSLKAL